jgi:spermidine synthase
MLLILLLFGSGFSALVYQILWLRLLALVFGVTVHAASTVLAAFMAGLAVGSVVSGRLADRVAAPARWFGGVELLIGVTALATPAALGALETVYGYVHSSISDDVRVLTFVRFLASFGVLIVPTALMGATFPLALRAALRNRPRLGSLAAALYASNTAGGVAGALVTGYYLVGTIGIAGSFVIAAGVNVVVGLSALIASRVSAPAPGDAAEHDVPHTLSKSMQWLVLGVAGVSGFVGLALEIVWFRTLVIFVPATTYVFTTILAIALGGIAAGSATVTRGLRRGGDGLRRLALLQMAIAMAAIASLAALSWTYARGWRTGAVLQAAGLSVLPTMLLMGAAFPVALSCWVGDARRSSGERVGRFYVVNLCGAIAGALAAGFLLIPWLGTRGALIVVASLSLTAGIAVLLTVARSRGRQLMAVGAVTLFAVIAAWLPDPLQTVLTRRFGGERVLARDEGAQATVSVHEGEHRIMYLDGLHQANDSPPMVALHRQIGALAMALHPRPRSALVIGLGGGVTAGAVAEYSDALVDVVELTPGVIRSAAWFAHVNGNVVQRTNVRLRVDDGRNHLLLTQQQYDVITADIIQPFHAGAGNLYSREYFALAQDKLRDDGLMLQWIGHRSESEYKLIARTFLDAFPHVTVWATGTLLVGSKQPLRLSRTRYEQRFAEPAFSRAVRGAGVGQFADLLRLFTAGEDEFRRFVGSGPILTDDRPLAEFFLSLPRGDPPIALAGLTGDVSPHVAP